NWDANLNTEVKFTKAISGQLRTQYTAPRVRAQGKTVANFVMDAGVKMSGLNKKGSIMLNVRDILNQRKWGGTTNTPEFSQEFQRRWMQRTFTLSLSYNFGQRDFTKRNEKRREQNDTRGDDDNAQF